ncbi:MAG: hypothetical protein J5I90_12220 [Caldilineales bacterium]|nr:hypothetical protein [Caldilineales bacterium]
MAQISIQLLGNFSVAGESGASPVFESGGVCAPLASLSSEPARVHRRRFPISPVAFGSAWKKIIIHHEED